MAQGRLFTRTLLAFGWQINISYAAKLTSKPPVKLPISFHFSFYGKMAKLSSLFNIAFNVSQGRLFT